MCFYVAVRLLKFTLCLSGSAGSGDGEVKFNPEPGVREALKIEGLAGSSASQSAYAAWCENLRKDLRIK